MITPNRLATNRPVSKGRTTVARLTQIFTLSFVLWMGVSLAKGTTPADPKVLHLLSRLSYGARPGDVERVTQMGVDRYIQQQLNPAAIPEPPELTRQLSTLTTLQLSPVALLQAFKSPSPQEGQSSEPQVRKINRQNVRQIVGEESVRSRLLRAVESDRQLQEQMVDFWFNHFNVFAGKGLTAIWIGDYENQAIRPHVLGKFRDLLAATVRHPAMLYYLDNWQNTAPDSPGARGMVRDPRVKLGFLAVGGWDTHVNQGHQLSNRLQALGRGLSILQRELGTIYGNTTILVMSEFGRTLRENGNGGTDHGHGNVLWVMGGKVRGGKVYGDWQGLATHQLYEGRDLPVTTDFRDVVIAVLERHLTLNDKQLSRVFPGYTPTQKITVL